MSRSRRSDCSIAADACAVGALPEGLAPASAVGDMEIKGMGMDHEMFWSRPIAFLSCHRGSRTAVRSSDWGSCGNRPVATSRLSMSSLILRT